MKKIIFILLFICMVGIYSQTSEAAEVSKDISVNAKTEYDITDVVEGVRVDEEVITVEMDDGTVIRATGEFQDSIRLMVMPITKSMTKEWNWLQSVTRRIGINKSAFDIFFINSAGERVDGGEGSQISIMTSQKLNKLMVYYIEASGKETKLKSQMEEYAVKFKMMKNGYYTLVMKNDKKTTASTAKPNKDKTTSTLKEDKDEDKDKDDDKDKEDDDKDKEDKDDDTEVTKKPYDDDTYIDDGTDDNDSQATKKPTDGSGTEDKDKEESNILYRLLIVFVFVGTGLIFFIILRKKNNKDEEDEYNRIE